MSFLNIDWEDLFGRKAKRKLKELEAKAFKDAYQEGLEKDEEYEKSYLKAYYSNGIITVVFMNGEVVSVEAKEDVFKTIVNSEWFGEEDIRIILNKVGQKEEKIDEEKEVLDKVKKLVDHDLEILEILGKDFKSDEKGFYYKDITLPIPPLVLESMVEYKKAENSDMFQRMVYFFLLLATSPIKACRDFMLTFCKKNDVRISPLGNVIAYRRIVKIEQDTRLKDFVDTSYAKVKKAKKSPKNYYVWAEDDGSYTLHKGICDRKSDGIGSFQGYLSSLKDSVNEPQRQLYTSQNNKGKYTFGIGDIYKADPDDILNMNGMCSAGSGLHASSVNYSYHGFGDTPVVVLVNPARGIVVPQYEWQKFRTTEMKVALINPNEHGVHISEDLIEEADREYADYTQEGLEEALKGKSFETLSVKDEVPVINLVDLKTIQNSLKNRVVKV